MECTVYKLTSDDWYPSTKTDDGMLVCISFSKLGTTHLPTWRVCAWGDDDFGLEKDFTSEADAWVCFLEVIGYKDVTHDSLRKLGFVTA